VFVTGYNDNGQCGVGNNQQVKQPTLIQALEGEEIAHVHVYNGCEHTLAVTRDGKLYSFGYNYRGQVSQVTFSFICLSHLCLFISTVAHNIYIFSCCNHFPFLFNYQLGHGSTASETVPRLVKGLMSRKVTLAACSYHHSIMLCADGALFTCGRNDCGQLALGDLIDKKVPQLVPTAPRDITGLSCGQYHTVIATESGAAFVCGKNDYGQLGLESVDNVKVFTKTQFSPETSNDGIKVAKCGYYHTLFLSHNGIVSGFGRNDYGQVCSICLQGFLCLST
jgi:alpha-tubulin suppressor-like RCC1 family protein